MDEGVPFGETPTYNGEEPTKPEDDEYTYNFIGWDPDISPVEGDITYTAVFDPVEKPNYSVVFTVTADPDQVQPGEEFEVTVELTGEYAGNGLQLYIEYDAENFEALGVENGDVLVAVANAFGLVVTDYETNPGSVRVAFIVDEAVDVEGTIVTITMRAKEEAEVGEYDLTPDVIMLFSSESTEQVDIEYETVPGTVEIIEPEETEYTVTYIVDGVEVEVQTYAEGDTIVPFECPDDLIPEGRHFVEWEGMPDDLVMPAQNITVYAVFEINTYTVTWVNWNGTELEVDEGVPFGTMPTYDGDEPTKEGDDQYSYNFIGWEPEVSEVEGDITYTAVFEEVVNTYTVTWVNWNGTELEVDEDVPYGETPSYNGETPTKEGNAQYSYNFIGWDPEISPVEGDITYTAVFEEAVNTYTVTFIYGYDLSLTETVEVPYGSAATAPELPEYFWYVFTDWDTDFSNVTEDITVIAQYFERGDADQDGDVDMSDALLILRYVMGLEPNADTYAMDIDGDGQITMVDALLVQRHVMGLLSPNIVW
ncbi:MAG: InlB B-repeat-containing protein [Clostridia bacterium]|nr:InlB B-repeat-containing protein [Clostridia bacterium]